jgi:hypothetical protein
MRRPASGLCVAVSVVVLAACDGGNSGPVTSTITGAGFGPGKGPGWRAVLEDYYAHGRLVWPHSCAEIREAIRHVPPIGPIYSPITPELRAYARGVCR